MARVRKPAPKRGDTTIAPMAELSPEMFPPEIRDRLSQGQLSRPLVHSLWHHLSRAQQKAVLAPERRIGQRYPLTSGDVAALTGLSPSRLRYGADQGLIPCWRPGRRRLFEAPGLIAAFSLSNDLRPRDLRFFQELAGAPVAALTTKLALIANALAARLAVVDQGENGIIAPAIERLRSARRPDVAP